MTKEKGQHEKILLQNFIILPSPNLGEGDGVNELANSTPAGEVRIKIHKPSSE